MKLEGLLKPPPYRYFGPLKGVDWHQLDHDIRFDRMPIPGEIEHSELRLQQIDEITSATLSFARDQLNLDLSDRASPYYKFHYLDKKNFLAFINTDEAVPEANNQISDEEYQVTGGITNPLNHICLPESEESTVLYCTQHELLHTLSYHSFALFEEKVTIDGTEAEIAIDPHQLGYQNRTSPSLEIVDEVLNEMTNMLIFDHLWQFQPHLYHIKNPPFTGYTYAINVVDELIYLFSKANKYNPDDVFRSLLQGKFTGWMDPLRELSRFIGKDNMKLLANLNSTPESAIQFCQQLGLTAAEKRIVNLQNKIDSPFMSEYFYH